MDALLREIRMGNLRSKIAACQHECTELARKSSTPDLRPEEWAAMSLLKEEAIRQCDHTRYMLGLYEQEG